MTQSSLCLAYEKPPLTAYRPEKEGERDRERQKEKENMCSPRLAAVAQASGPGTLTWSSRPFQLGISVLSNGSGLIYGSLASQVTHGRQLPLCSYLAFRLEALKHWSNRKRSVLVSSIEPGSCGPANHVKTPISHASAVRTTIHASNINTHLKCRFYDQLL